jgi:hypothetical protein
MLDRDEETTRGGKGEDTFVVRGRGINIGEELWGEGKDWEMFNVGVTICVFIRNWKSPIQDNLLRGMVVTLSQ